MLSLHWHDGVKSSHGAIHMLVVTSLVTRHCSTLPKHVSFVPPKIHLQLCWQLARWWLGGDEWLEGPTPTMGWYKVFTMPKSWLELGAGSVQSALMERRFVWGYNYDANDPVDSADLLSLGIRMNCADIIQTTGGSALNFAILLRDGKLITFDASTYSISDIVHRDNMRTCFNPLVESGSGTTAVACNAAFGIALQQARLRPRLLLWGEYPDVEDNEFFFSVYGMVILDNVRVKSVVTNTGAACALLEDRTIHVFGTSFHGACCTSLMRRETVWYCFRSHQLGFLCSNTPWRTDFLLGQGRCRFFVYRQHCYSRYNCGFCRPAPLVLLLCIQMAMSASGTLWGNSSSWSNTLSNGNLLHRRC